MYPHPTGQWLANVAERERPRTHVEELRAGYANWGSGDYLLGTAICSLVASMLYVPGFIANLPDLKVFPLAPLLLLGAFLALTGGHFIDKAEQKRRRATRQWEEKWSNTLEYLGFDSARLPQPFLGLRRSGLGPKPVAPEPFVRIKPFAPKHAEDVAAVKALAVGAEIISTDVWQHPQLLDERDARLDLATELRDIFHACHAVADVRKTVGRRPRHHTREWQLEVDALDAVAQQIDRRIDNLAQYAASVSRIQDLLDEQADEDRRRDVAAAVDGLIKRHAGAEISSDYAALLADHAIDATIMVEEQLRAAHAIKTTLARSFDSA